jgi:UDP-N-acetylmuramate: L-alanyl-gamma-D-glutamyl-meso-diaminopimelate ligase
MRVYFMGIGGLAMGNVALLAKQMGHEVSGSDTVMYPPMAKALEGCQLLSGYSAERLQELKPEAVVIGNAIGRGNAELEWFWNEKPCAYYSMAGFVQERVLRGRPTVAVCGTHGKTTTTTLTAYLLQHNSANPGWLIGGVPQDLPSGANVGGRNTPFVIEGDEYDSAFFDKRAKFISYTPTIAVLNNLEPDHLDIYRDLEDIKRSFSHLLRIVPQNGAVVANIDDANLCSLLPVKWTSTFWVSAHDNPQADLHIRDFSESPTGSCFSLYYRGRLWGQISWSLTGIYNARNAAMAALAAGLAYDREDPTRLRLDALASFVGVKRRQEVRHSSPQLVVVDDFGHHPTAVQETLRSLRSRYGQRRWIACLEPRSNTSRTNVHQSSFPSALALADRVLLAPVFQADKLPADKRLDTARLASDISTLGGHARNLKSCADIPAAINEITQEGGEWGVVFYSNGNFEGALQQYLDSLATTAKVM